jgi:beta-N-acetylhexosaminidase
MGMTAHLVMEAIDPELPATVSPAVMKVIREDIGFDGLMMTDDISMQALSGTVGERSLAALNAGCDLTLHSNGYMPEMEEIAGAIRQMDADAVRRAEAALAQRRPPTEIDIQALDAELETLLTAG